MLGWIPQSDPLIQLHQLVYLHFQGEYGTVVKARLGFAIRWLSVHHQLRSLSTDGIWHGIEFVIALLSCEAQSPLNAEVLVEFNGQANPPLDPTVSCGLEDLSLGELTSMAKPFLGSVPSLTRLQIAEVDEYNRLLDTQLVPSLEIILPRLQQLRIEFSRVSPRLQHLTRCTALRVVHLARSSRYRWEFSLTCTALQPLLHAWSATLEECYLGFNMHLAPKEEWIGLAACQRLRRFEMKLNRGQELPERFVAVLQELPSFHTLVLSWEGAAIRPLPINLLTVMARSRSFSTLHLHALSDSQRVPDFLLSKSSQTPARGLSHMLSILDPALLTSQTLARIRVVGHYGQTGWHPGTQSFRIEKQASNKHVRVAED